jgi:endonuclease/exonuclease/phosphatase family metal-dependent hydrolase
MKIVTCIIQFGLGKDNRHDLARVASEVKDADIIALQEVDRHWQRSGCVDAWVVAGLREDAGATIGSGRRIDVENG